MQRSFGSVVVAAAIAGLVTLCGALCGRGASASLLEAGIQGGAQQRDLSDVAYKWAFAWQVHADVAIIPPILMMGASLGFSKATPDGTIPSTDTQPRGVNFRTAGVRAKLRIPIPGDFTPYGIAGIGWVHGDFPDQQFKKCIPGVAACEMVLLPNATADFVEFVLGAGFLYLIGGPMGVTFEVAWRPTTGYKNDVYEQQYQRKSTDAPSPGRNGKSWTVMAGLAIVL